MALTPRKFSDDTAFTGAWGGNDLIPVVVDTGGGVLRNRKASILQAQKMRNIAFGSLPSASTAGAGTQVWVTDASLGPVLVVSDGTNWIIQGSRVYDVGLFVPGVPDTVAQPKMQKIVVIRDITIPADMSGAVGHVETNPDAQFDIDVQVDGVSIGTISISTGGVFTFTTTSSTAKNIDSGSRLEFIGPSTTEVSMSELAVTIPAVLRLVT